MPPLYKWLDGSHEFQDEAYRILPLAKGELEGVAHDAQGQVRHRPLTFSVRCR